MKRKIISMLVAFSMVAGLFQAVAAQQKDWKSNAQNVIDDKYRTFYEIFLYSYCDSDGDGIGDINGLISKLDYLNDGNPKTTDDLGINGIWLMPVMESPSYHKYDTVDYKKVDPEYGTNDDFKRLMEECHKRGINVIIDLAMNHSSNQHPWFTEAYSYVKEHADLDELDSSECEYVDYYNFSKEFQSGYAKVEGTDWYYEAQFWEGMPDLNLLNPQVKKEYEDIASYWLDLGVDGFRLDAVKYFQMNDHDSCIETLSWFNDYVKSIKENAYIVCECWDNQQVYAKYYESGVDSMFDFAFADIEGKTAKMVNGKVKGSAYVDALVEEDAMYREHSASYINAPFYTNHDMARSAGFYSGEFAEAKVKMAEGLNILSTGNVFIYYGDELGMKGSGKDENKRAPMQWSSDSASEGMCKGPKDMESIDMKYKSLEDQEENPNSIYNYVKDAILIRNQNPEIARGKITNLTDISYDNIAAMKKTYDGSDVYVLVNNSEEEQTVDVSSLGEVELVGKLIATETENEIEIKDGSVVVPALSILVMK